MQQRDSIEQRQSRDQQFNQYRRTRSSKYQLETIVRNSYVTQQTKQKPLANIYQMLFKILKTINTKQLQNKRKNKIILRNIQSNYQKIVNQIQDNYQIKLAQVQQNNKIKQVEYQSRIQDKNKIIQQLNKRLDNSNQIIKSLKHIVNKNQQNKKSNQQQQTVDRQQQNSVVNRYLNQNNLMNLQIIQLRQQKQRIEKQITDLRISHMQLEQKLKQSTKENERYKIRIQEDKRQKQYFQLQISNLKQINQQFSYKLNNIQAKNQQKIQVFTSIIKQLEVNNQQLQTKLQQQIIKQTKLQKQLSLVIQSQSKIQILSSSQKKQKQSIIQQIQILQKINKTLISQQQQYIKQQQQYIIQQQQYIIQQQQYLSQIKTKTQKITIFQAKLQQKQKQFMELITNSKIDEIQNELSKKNKQIIQLKNRIVSISQTYHRKQEQFIQYKKQQINIIKQNQQQKDNILSPAQNLQMSNNKIELQNSCSYDSKDKQQDIQQAQLQIIKCKYNILQKMYLELKKQKQFNYIQKIEAAIQTQNYEDQRKYSKQQENQRQSQNDDMTIRNSMSNANPRPLKKKTLSGYDLFMNTQQPKLDISIVADSVNYNNKNKSTSNSAINSPAASIYNLNNFIKTSQLQKIIRNFNYNNSILHKINTSKFITNPTSKIGFIFQYVCYLQLFFSNLFKNGVIEKLIMGQEMDIIRLRKQDFVDNFISEQEDNKKLEKIINLGSKGRESDSSFLSQSNSKILSNSKMYIVNQFSLNTIARAQDSPISRKNKLVFVFNAFSQNLTPEISKKPIIQKICKIEQQMLQIQNFFTSYSLKPDLLSQNSQAIQKLSQLSHNKITKLILKLLKQNEIMKNCVNVMLKNQETITKANNDIYFGIQSQQQINNTKPQQNIYQQNNQENNTNVSKQNCNIM